MNHNVRLIPRIYTGNFAEWLFLYDLTPWKVKCMRGRIPGGHTYNIFCQDVLVICLYSPFSYIILLHPGRDNFYLLDLMYEQLHETNEVCLLFYLCAGCEYWKDAALLQLHHSATFVNARDELQHLIVNGRLICSSHERILQLTPVPTWKQYSAPFLVVGYGPFLLWRLRERTYTDANQSKK